MATPAHSADGADGADALAEAVGALAQAAGVRVAAAESLTGGAVCALLAKATDASEWFAGGIVAYGSDVKHALLAVPPGPVVSAEAAAAMAESAALLTKAQFAVSLTGAGGPDPQDGQPPGTVYLGIASPVGTRVERLDLEGDPGQVCRQAAWRALKGLEDLLRSFVAGAPG